MIRLIVLSTILVLSGCALSPLQYKAADDIGLIEHKGHIVWTAEQVADKLSYWYPDVLVMGGEYRILKPYEMPYGYWCSQFNTFDDPSGWVCQDYAEWADKERPGYAYGTVWNFDHMLNVGLVEAQGGEVMVFFYEPIKCLWVDAPVGIEGMFIN